MNDKVEAAGSGGRDRGAILKGWLLASLVEVVTLPPVLLTMGHAGLEGRFAAFGWLGLLLNLPGLIAARAVVRPADVPPAVFGLVTYLFQAALLGYIFLRLLKRKQA